VNRASIEGDVVPLRRRVEKVGELPDELWEIHSCEPGFLLPG
jgi:hypothetical protein